jgi:hypothetical protein
MDEAGLAAFCGLPVFDPLDGLPIFPASGPGEDGASSEGSSLLSVEALHGLFAPTPKPGEAFTVPLRAQKVEDELFPPGPLPLPLPPPPPPPLSLQQQQHGHPYQQHLPPPLPPPPHPAQLRAAAAAAAAAARRRPDSGDSQRLAVRHELLRVGKYGALPGPRRYARGADGETKRRRRAMQNKISGHVSRVVTKNRLVSLEEEAARLEVREAWLRAELARLAPGERLDAASD